MNVFVGVRRQKLSMSVPRIMNLDFGDVTLSAERPRRAVSHRQDDDEIVDASESALDFLTGRQRHGDAHRVGAAAASATGVAADPCILQLRWIGYARADS